MTFPVWKSAVLNAYYHASRPWRAWYRREAASRGRLPLVVLFYHRVADDNPNPWTISTRSFVRHLDWLQANCEMVPLGEIQRRMRAIDSRRPCVSITFDDGYADNCREAIPLLIKRRIPCTYFVTFRNVRTGEPFPQDLALGQPLAPNSPEQLQAMAEAGVEIAAHGYTHCDMGTIQDMDRLKHEILAGGLELQEMLGRRVRYFAFPFGFPQHLSCEAFQVAWRAGYEAVCSAYGGYNFPGDDAFHLQRIHADEGLARLRNRVTLDPRMLAVREVVWTPPCEHSGSQPKPVAAEASCLAGQADHE